MEKVFTFTFYVYFKFYSAFKFTHSRSIILIFSHSHVKRIEYLSGWYGCGIVLRTDVRSLLLKLDDYQIHDVSNALKRLFRSLDEPLLTVELYPQWIAAASLCF